MKNLFKLVGFWGVVLIFFVGCIQVNIGGEGEPCNSNGICESGLVCVNGVCVKPSNVPDEDNDFEDSSDGKYDEEAGYEEPEYGEIDIEIPEFDDIELESLEFEILEDNSNSEQETECQCSEVNACCDGCHFINSICCASGRTPRIIPFFGEFLNSIGAFAISEASNIVAVSPVASNTIYFYSLESGERINLFLRGTLANGETISVLNFANITPEVLLLGTSAGYVQFWNLDDINSPQEDLTKHLDDFPVLNIDFTFFNPPNPDFWWAAITQGGSAFVYENDFQVKVFNLASQGDGAFSMDLNNDNYLVVGTTSGKVMVWDRTSLDAPVGTEDVCPSGSGSSFVDSVKFVSDNEFAALSNDCQTLKVFEIVSNGLQVEHSVNISSSKALIATAPAQGWLALFTPGSEIKVFNVADWSELLTVQLYPASGDYLGAYLSEDGKYLAVMYSDSDNNGGVLYLWCIADQIAYPQ